jgi:hypothetical protein
LSAELKRIGIPNVSHVASLTQTDLHFPEIVESLAPQGKFGLIDDPKPIDVNQLKRKSISLHWELNVHALAVWHNRHDRAAPVAHRSGGARRRRRHPHDFRRAFGRINAENLKRAHALLESGKAKGKIVLEEF